MTGEASSSPNRWTTLAAFGVIYIVWGSTFLAIRIGVHEVAPLILAAIRFLLAGAVLLIWCWMRKESIPTRTQLASAALLAFLIFVVDYGLLFWAEQRVPSGIAAVMMATIPVFMALAEVVFLRTQRLTARLVAALLVGLVGVAVLMSHSFNLGSSPIDSVGAAALIVASLAWSIGSILTRKIPLPASKIMSSGTQMLLGGIMLTIAAAGTGEFQGFHFAAVSVKAWLALAYLVGLGSILGFTTYVWLIEHQSPTRVGTYAYVNPVVAVVIGYFLGGEALGLRTVLGSICVLVSVLLITTGKVGKAAAPKEQKVA